MSEEDEKLQKHLIDEMMKVSKTNPDVMIYMGILMKNYEKLEEEIKRLKEDYMILQNASDEVEEEKDKEIERLTAESTKWESKFYDEAKKVDKAIEYIENKNKYLDSENYYQVFEYRDIYLKPLLDILKGVDKE